MITNSNLDWCMRELYSSSDLLTSNEHSILNFIVDSWDYEGKLAVDDLKKLDDIYIAMQIRKGYYLC